VKTLHTFGVDDPRARFTYQGMKLRAVGVLLAPDGSDHDLSVIAMRQTRTGSDYTVNGRIWLALHYTPPDLVAYIRTLTPTDVQNSHRDRPILSGMLVQVANCDTTSPNEAGQIGFVSVGAGDRYWVNVTGRGWVGPFARDELEIPPSLGT
jgi:hypothetical protein